MFRKVLSDSYDREPVWDGVNNNAVSIDLHTCTMQNKLAQVMERLCPFVQVYENVASVTKTTTGDDGQVHRPAIQVSGHCICSYMFLFFWF